MTNRPGILIKILLSLVLAVLGLCAFANSMTKEISPDEHMYCTAGVMMAQGKAIYKDFSYVAQMPYHPLLYSALYKIIPSNQYLLIARLTSVACNIVVLIALLGLCRHALGKSSVLWIPLGLTMALIYVFNPVVDYANGHAWNNDAVTMFIMLALWLLITTDYNRPRQYPRIALIAALLTVATFMRPTTAIIQLAFLLAVCFKPANTKDERLGRATSFLTATALVAIWPAYIIARSPAAFWLNSVTIQLLNSRYLKQIGMELGKADAVSRCIITWEYLSLLAVTALLWLYTIAKRRRMTTAGLRNFILPIVLSVLLFAIAFALPTTWAQHLAAPVPFILISLIYPVAYMHTLSRPDKRNYPLLAAVSAIIICAAISISLNPLVFKRLEVVLNPRRWMPNQLHETAQDIAAKVPQDAPLLTLAPLYALEGGRQIYTELSAGPFVYRIADQLSDDQLTTLHAVAPKTLNQLTDSSPPAAVIVALEPHDLEGTLPKAVLGPGWGKLVYSETGPVVYFKP